MTSAAAVPDWGVDAGSEVRGPAAVWVGVVALLPGVAAAAVAALLEGPALGAVLVATYAVALAGWVGYRRNTLVRALGGEPVDPAAWPRPVNILRGLCSDLDMPAPALYAVADEGANAAVAPGAVVLTRGLVETSTRTELEAAIAHCVVRLATGDASRAATAVALSWAGGRALAPEVGRTDDIAAAAVTRFPPALAAAVSRCRPRSGPTAPLWFVADGPTHRSVEDRVAALADL